MTSWIRAGVLYCLTIFAVAFVLGSVRVLWAAPRVGPVIAVLLETPLVLLVSWAAARRISPRAIDGELAGRGLMGVIALALLMGLEFGLGAVLGRSASEQLAGMQTPAGLIGLAGQAGFAAIPILQALWDTRRASR